MLRLILFLFFYSLTFTVSSSTNSTLPQDAISLLSFKQTADQTNKLLYTLNEPYDYCQWQGVKCAQGRVVRFVLQSFSLTGFFPPNTLTRLDQLRVLSLRNNSLSGPIPDLSPLINLKSLFLDRNNFSGSFPPSILFLHRLITLSLSHNNLTGSLPLRLTLLDRLISLRLDSNSFTGPLPPLNQTELKLFNVSTNNLTGPVPVTQTLTRFKPLFFSQNPGLCGEIIHKQCTHRSRFFGSSNATVSSSAPLSQSAESQVFTLIIIGLVRKNNTGAISKSKSESSASETIPAVAGLEARTEVEAVTKVKMMEEAHRSGKLVFCCGEVQEYTLEQLMRASAELLGRGSVGTTYKAVMDSKGILTVKRLDAGKSGVMSGEEFQKHMEIVGRLRHPNLVPLKAFFQAKGERLVIYDFQPNGSLFNLVHGSRSARAKPLHWTSCLKIAEDVAHGLAYIHQVSSLIHGNLKSSNVLLGGDFEACITDYCLAFLMDSSFTEDPDSAAYQAPEVRKSYRRASSKSDVYAFGVLLLELLTGKHPSKHPFLAPMELQDWVRAMRDDDFSEDNRLEMLTEVASICSATSPEQRPAMWQVLKMIQGIKDSISMEDTELTGVT
ncbi:unnamed protein product [Vicia faba]|uniref:Protein kinase domain-containing protein n=1 Tax=Vicia faba TaxID=3906 RepID=A0AAV1AGC5_VICFA|nr:unnamed protein product [Vicia faba]